MYAMQWDMAEKYAEMYKEKMKYPRDSDMAAACMSRYYHMHAWMLLLKKQYIEAMAAMGQAIKTSQTPSSTKKEKLDLQVNKIFFLTLKLTEEKKKTVIPEAPQRSKSALFWSKLLKKKEAGGSEPAAEIVPAAEKSQETEELQACMETLDKILDKMCRRQLNSGDPRDPVATEEFFYKERYVKFLEFILALYKDGVEAGEKALEEMEGSPRCRLCNHGCCMRLKIAKALLLEKQGKADEAYDIYEQLAKDQPYNTFAQVKLLFKEK